jgi:hypothetical protein
MVGAMNAEHPPSARNTGVHIVLRLLGLIAPYAYFPVYIFLISNYAQQSRWIWAVATLALAILFSISFNISAIARRRSKPRRSPDVEDRQHKVN